MDSNSKKCVLVIDRNLGVGVTANVTAILAMSVGHRVPELVGKDIIDKDGTLHSGLSQLPIPVLGATSEEICNLRAKIFHAEDNQLEVFDFNNFSQQAMTYKEYTDLLENADQNTIQYMGIAIFGDRRDVNRVTKKLKLLGA